MVLKGRGAKLLFDHVRQLFFDHVRAVVAVGASGSEDARNRVKYETLQRCNASSEVPAIINGISVSSQAL
jgi:hypothetical protein